MAKPQPWSQKDATDNIRAIAAHKSLSLTYTLHAKAQMAERDLIIGEINYVLKHGFVHTDAQPSTRENLYKYRIECRSPNYNNRTVRIVVIPCARASFRQVGTG
jgi:hypothetical protein